MGMNHAPTILLFVHEEATEATNKQEMTRRSVLVFGGRPTDT